MKKLTINNFAKLTGERILVNGVYWAIYNAEDGTVDPIDGGLIGHLLFVGRSDVVTIRSEIGDGIGVDPYVNMVYQPTSKVNYTVQLRVEVLRTLDSALEAIGDQLTGIRNGW